MDTLKSGQPPYNGQTACPLPTTVCMDVRKFSKKGQPPNVNNGQNTRPQHVQCSEVPLYYSKTQTVMCCVPGPPPAGGAGGGGAPAGGGGAGGPGGGGGGPPGPV